MTIHPLMMINGLVPDRLGPTILRISRGSCAAAGPGNEGYDQTGTLDVNIANVGYLGRDVAAAPTDGTDWFIYLLKKGDGTNSAILSRSLTYNGVAWPNPTDVPIRKLPWGIIYDVKKYGGFPEYHISHWPMPFTRITAPKPVITNVKAAAYTQFSLASFMPDNARLAYLQLQVKGVGTAGQAFISPQTNDLFSINAGMAIPNFTNTQTVHIRPNSDRLMWYKTTGGAQLTIMFLGYSQTERS